MAFGFRNTFSATKGATSKARNGKAMAAATILMEVSVLSVSKGDPSSTIGKRVMVGIAQVETNWAFAASAIGIGKSRTAQNIRAINRRSTVEGKIASAMTFFDGRSANEKIASGMLT